MSLDVTLYTNLAPDELSEKLANQISNTPYISYEDWQKVHPPGRFDSEILADMGIHIQVKSRVIFRVRKDNTEQEYEFLESLLSSILEVSRATMLLNGEDVLFSFGEQV